MCAVAVALALAAPARADDAKDRALTHFRAGEALYKLGNYTDAIREFAAGYELAPEPGFVVNLGQAYRKLGDLDKAREMYKKFLAEAKADDPARPGVLRVLDEIDREIAARPPKVTPPPKEEPPPQVTEPEKAPATQVEAKSGIRRFWWIIPVVAAVLAGAAVGLYFALRPSGVDCSSVSLGCIDSTK
jgi:tetratricopeptide (TPR) repeat protein